MSVFESIQQLLDTHSVEYKTEHHEPTRTSEDAARIRGVAMHTGAKALVLTGSKSGAHFLFVIPADLRLDSKKVRTILGESTSFAKDTVEVTDCVPGSVPPFGSVIGLKTHCDSRLAENERINFNAGSLTDSINMSYQDYIRVEQPMICDIAEQPHAL
jgi:prolyl-tRNA editing enzyme YbaK/EbsC (Cys-tRNA(Pro) deacylase)